VSTLPRPGVRVELLYVPDCPSWGATAALLAALARELDFTWSAVPVATPEAGQALGFHGSPSVHIAGIDPFADPAETAGLACRIYRTGAGLATVPDTALLRSALALALQTTR
jgi:hypothetical protein